MTQNQAVLIYLLASALGGTAPQAEYILAADIPELVAEAKRQNISALCFSALSAAGLYGTAAEAPAFSGAGGTGDVTFTACERKQPKHIILSDYTPAMLEVAQSRLDAGEANGVPVELVVVDGQDIPYEDGSFDIITMSYGIRNMPERERAL